MEGEFVLGKAPCLAGLFYPGPVVLRRDALVLGPVDEGEQGGQEAQRLAQGAGFQNPQRKLPQVIQEEQALVPLIQDLEVRGQARQGGVLPEDPLAHRVVGGHPGVQRGVAHPVERPVQHLLRRLVGEGEHQKLARALDQPLLDEVGDAAGDDGGLAGAHPGQDQ